MEVYEFDKCLLDRLQELEDVLSFKDPPIPASQIRSEWSYFVEVQIEPTGWQALWKIPRVICEELDIRYPTVVFGLVEQVLFKELKAIFTIQAVEDDDVQLPENQEVYLEDLWPTKKQENTELNIEKTAECIDQLRFFYNNIWMPWDNDNDDDQDWVEKHLESRLKFCLDLKKKKIKRSVATHIKTLLAEARYIQKRREYLELDLSDDEECDDALNALNKSHATDLMRLHLRLNIIKSEIEMLENPEMRNIYEQIKFDDEKYLKQAPTPNLMHNNLAATTYIVTKPNSVQNQLDLLIHAKKMISDDKIVQMCTSLQEALNICNSSNDIILPPGRHSIKFLEYLNDNGSLIGLTSDLNPSSEESLEKLPQLTDVTIMSQDFDSILLVFDGDFTLKNLTLDCRYIRTGVLIKNGSITLENCRIIGDSKSSIRQGFITYGNSKLLLKNCIIQNFATGIIMNEQSKVILDNTTIYKCRVGIELKEDSLINFNNSKISHSATYGLWIDKKSLNYKATTKKVTAENFSDVEQYFNEAGPWSGSCTFENNARNIVLINEQATHFSPKLRKVPSDSLDSVAGSTFSDLRIKSDSFDGSILDDEDDDVIIIDDSVIEDED